MLCAQFSSDDRGRKQIKSNTLIKQNQVINYHNYYANEMLEKLQSVDECADALLVHLTVIR